ncbi:MAG: ATP synthase F1 subunit delta [Patescibacteria group bacterium]
MKITPRKYAEALAQALEESKDPSATINNFLLLLRRRKQFKLLPKIVHSFEATWRKKKGILKMEVAYPTKFENSVNEFKQTLGRKLGKEIELHAKPSLGLIGGLRIRLEDKLIDASIEGRLRALERALQNC